MNEREIALRLLTPERRSRPPSGVVWERRDTVAAGDDTIATWSVGAGPAVVLAHGWETDHRDMDAFVAPLVAAGRRVVAFDHPAHGESTGERASIPDLARTVAAVCAAAGGADAIVGHSVGCAAIGVALASGLGVRSAVFVAPPLRYEIFVRAVARREGLDGDAVVAAFAELGLDVGALDVRENGASLDVPLLIVHSRDDRVCDPDNATAIAAAWQGARTRFVDGLGHARILRDPEVVRDVCDFVATGAPG